MAPAAESLRRYQTFFRHRRAKSVLDYGAGKLRNSLFLAGKGFRVFAADIPEQAARIRSWGNSGALAGVLDTDELEAARLNVDLVVSTYVFNIIPDVAARNRYLENAAAALSPGGHLLLEVRCHRESQSCGDCIRSDGCPGCPKSFSHHELDRVVTPFGFRRLCHYYRRHALAAVYERVAEHTDSPAKPGLCPETGDSR